MKTTALIVLFLVSAALTGAIVRGAAFGGGGGPPDKKSETSMTTTAKAGPVYSKLAYDVTPLTPAQVDELAKKLTPEEAKVILKKGTEAAFCGNLTDNKKEGVYTCRLCGLPLFASDSKFHSGTGWPSFFQPVDKAHVHTERDTSYGMERDEIICARCGAHLGPRLRGRSQAHGPALLRELRLPPVQREGPGAPRRVTPPPDRHGVLRGRVLLGRRGLLPAAPRRHRRRQRLHGRQVGGPHL